MGIKMYYWLGCKTGYVMSSVNVCPVTKPKERLKYIGFTEDTGWPKKMNTGRLLHKPIKKKKLRHSQ